MVEYPIGTLENAPARVGTQRYFHSDLASDIVAAIWDCDIPDGDLAKGFTIKRAKIPFSG